ncbi:MAG: NAD(P)/FAD-dependent oxidoreductase [Acidobacteriota bacterium]
MTSRPDALVAGGGPAGAAVAAHLARRGRTVVLLEQSAAAHHKVCGEFLSHEAVDDLQRLGILVDDMGAAPIHAVRLSGRKQIAACELPFPARSLSRYALDEALLAVAARAGAEVRRSRRVDRIEPSPDGWLARFSNGQSQPANAVFLATGKHDVNGHRRPPGKQSNLVAFKMHFRLASAQRQALHGWVELFVYPGGYAGLQLTESADANLCLVATRTMLRRCEGEWPALLERICTSSEALAERLDGAQPLFPKPLALSSIPYGMLLAQSAPGLWRLGDQAAVIPSFAGDGISIALHSARRAADFFLRGASSHEFARSLHAELRRSVGAATGISQALVTVPALAHAARLWPPVLRLIASRTRIPAGALSDLSGSENRICL